MKKLVAIVMTVAMLVSCMPMMAFAAVPPEEPPADAQLEPKPEPLMELNGKVYDEILKYVSDEDFVELFNLVNDTIDQYQEFAKLLMDNKEEALGFYLSFLDEYVAQVNRYVVDLQSSEEAKALLDKISENTATLRELLDKYGYGVDTPEDVKASIDKIMADQDQALEDLWALLQDEIIQDALKGLCDQLKAELAKNGITEEDIDAFIEQAKIVKELIEKYANEELSDEEIEALLDKAEALLEDLFEKALDEIIKQAEAILDENGITKEDIDELFDLIKELQEIAEQYKGLIDEFDPDNVIDSLIDIAKELFEENQDAIIDAAMDAAYDLLDRIEEGAIDEYLPAGMTGEQLVDLITDVVAYAFGLMDGEGYLDVQMELMDALFELDELTYENGELQDEIAGLLEYIQDLEKEAKEAAEKYGEAEKQIEELQGTIKQLQDDKDADAEIIKKFINGYNVQKKKPALKKVKAIKKKRVKVTFKGLKKLEVSKYQINYKSGKKKAKTKTWKKKTTSAKKLNYTLKKLKKGKRCTVKVRAVYQFKYKGKTYKFVSKWSKKKSVKKVK